jgi:hypothetical protein
MGKGRVEQLVERKDEKMVLELEKPLLFLTCANVQLNPSIETIIESERFSLHDI